jgi:xanthine/uracil/vitamin C permease (AzgA family)
MIVREVIAAITTFFTMAYIVIVNPTILSTAGTGMPFSGVLTATVCSTMTLLMLTAVVTAVCFVPCLFIAQLASAVPPYATAAVLIMVGVAMFQMVAQISFERLEEAVPAFATLVLIPLTFSITKGMLWGFILHAALQALSGRAREVSRTVWALAFVSAGLLVLEHYH